MPSGLAGATYVFGRIILPPRFWKEPMSPQQMADYRAHKDSYFGKIVPVGGKIDDPFALFEWFVETHKWMSRDQLLAKLAQTPNIAALRTLSDNDLLCEYRGVFLPSRATSRYASQPSNCQASTTCSHSVTRKWSANLCPSTALAASCSSSRTPSGQHAAGGRRLSQAVTFGVKTPPVIGRDRARRLVGLKRSRRVGGRSEPSSGGRSAT